MNLAVIYQRRGRTAKHEFMSYGRVGSRCKRKGTDAAALARTRFHGDAPVGVDGNKARAPAANNCRARCAATTSAKPGKTELSRVEGRG